MIAAGTSTVGVAAPVHVHVNRGGLAGGGRRIVAETGLFSPRPLNNHTKRDTTFYERSRLIEPLATRPRDRERHNL